MGNEDLEVKFYWQYYINPTLYSFIIIILGPLRGDTCVFYARQRMCW